MNIDTVRLENKERKLKLFLKVGNNTYMHRIHYTINIHIHYTLNICKS